MPIIDGAELAARVRQRIPGVRTLFVTGDANAPEFGEVTQSQLLKKPFRQTDLAQKLDHLLCRNTPETA
jgi:CheY-like chemotaxis protein